jgi:thiamine-phosphate pyrophosphorylase
MIPKLHYISQGSTAEEHISNIEQACSYGVELVQLRLKDLDENTLLQTAKKVREITAHFQTRLIINDYYKIAKEVKADGVHLGESDASPAKARKHLQKFQMIGGTANTYGECLKLITQKVDYIGLGPFRFTKTKENLSPILGVDGYADIVKKLKSNIPIIAVGGIILGDVDDILTTGVHGIAVSGEITNDFNTIPLFNKKLNTPSQSDQVWKMK